EGSGAVGERTVDDVTVPGHPADVGRTPVDVFFTQVENPFMGQSTAEQVAGGRVQDALGFPCRAAGVEDVQRMFAVEWLGGTVGGSVRHQVVPPQVAAGLHIHFLIAAIEDDTFLDGRRLGEGSVDVFLERDDLAAAPAAVGGDEQPRLRIVVAIGDGL